MKIKLSVLGFALFGLSLLATSFAPVVSADWLLDRSGTLIQVDGSVLGDDDAVEQEAESAKDRAEQEREYQKDRQEQSREASKKQLENQIEARKKIQVRTETKSEVKVKNENDKLKIQQEIRDKNGKVVKKQEIEVKDQEKFMVEGEDKKRLEINAVKDGGLEITRSRIKTSSNLELKMDDKNEISVTLPNGNTKAIELPEKALENLVSKGIITSVDNESGNSSYELTAGKSGEPVYQIDGQIEKKFLGLFKLKFAQKIEVAAGNTEDNTVVTGDIVNTESLETSPLRKFLERLSR